MPEMTEMEKTPKGMPDKEEFRLRAFPSDIRCGVRYPLRVAFPNSGDHPKEGKTVEYRLVHTSAVKVPRSGWCLVVVLTATVKGAPWAASVEDKVIRRNKRP